MNCQLNLQNNNLLKFSQNYLQLNRTSDNLFIKNYYSGVNSQTDYLSGLEKYGQFFFGMFIISLSIFLFIVIFYWIQEKDLNRKFLQVKRKDQLKYKLLLKILNFLILGLAITSIILIDLLPSQQSSLQCMQGGIQQYLVNGSGSFTGVNNLITNGLIMRSSSNNGYTNLSNTLNTEYALMNQYQTQLKTIIINYQNNYANGCYKSPSLQDSISGNLITSYFFQSVIGSNQSSPNSIINATYNQLDQINNVFNQQKLLQNNVNNYLGNISIYNSSLNNYLTNLLLIKTNAAQVQYYLSPRLTAAQLNTLNLFSNQTLQIVYVSLLIFLSVSTFVILSLVFQKNEDIYRVFMLLQFILTCILTALTFYFLISVTPIMIQLNEHCQLNTQILQNKQSYQMYFMNNPELQVLQNYIGNCLYGDGNTLSYFNVSYLYNIYQTTQNITNPMFQYSVKNHTNTVQSIYDRFNIIINTTFSYYANSQLFNDAATENLLIDRNPFVALQNLNLWVDASQNQFIYCRNPQDQYVINTANCTYPLYVNEVTTPLGSKTCITINQATTSFINTRYFIAFNTNCQYQYTYLSIYLNILQQYFPSRNAFFNSIQSSIPTLRDNINTYLNLFTLRILKSDQVKNQLDMALLFNLNNNFLDKNSNCKNIQQQMLNYQQQLCQSYVPYQFQQFTLFMIIGFVLLLNIIPSFIIWNRFRQIKFFKIMNIRIQQGSTMFQPNQPDDENQFFDEEQQQNQNDENKIKIEDKKEQKESCNVSKDEEIDLEKEIAKADKEMKVDLRGQAKNVAKWAKKKNKKSKNNKKQEKDEIQENNIDEQEQ